MLLIDGEGLIRGVYNGTLPTEASRVIEDIRTLEREQRQGFARPRARPRPRET